MRSHRARLLAALSLSLIAGCGSDGGSESEPGPPPRPAAAEAGAHDLSHGDSLFAALGDAQLEGYPFTNLPAALQDMLADSLPIRTRDFAAELWVSGGGGPRKFRDALVERQHRFWRYRPPLALASRQAPVEVFVDGRRMAPWDPDGDDPMPEGYAYWIPRDRTLAATWPKKPGHVSVRYETDARGLLAATELCLTRDGDLPEPEDLVQRLDVGGFSRRTLLLPAPARLRFPLQQIPGDRLRFSHGVRDKGFTADGDAWREQAQASDGVLFAVEVEIGEHRYRVYERHLPRDEVGGAFVDAEVDLSRFRGMPGAVHLISDPGPDGDADFDYALWSGLRIDGGREQAPDRPHVVLMDIDTLRADGLSCYGNPRPTSPVLDAWTAENALRFADCASTGAWTPPSTASMLTGLAVHQHGFEFQNRRLRDGSPTLARSLSEHGYETRANTGEGFLQPSFGFDQGFESYRHQLDFDGPHWDEGLSWLEDRDSEQPAFLFLHTYYVHAPFDHDDRFEDGIDYDGPFAGKGVDYETLIQPFRDGRLKLSEADIEYVRRQYAAQIARFDEHLPEVFRRLEQAFGDDPWIMVITSDHGEEFLDHGNLAHGQSLFHELLHVPLIVRTTDRRRGVVEDPVSLVDIVPTILGLVGIEVPDYLPGQPLLEGRDPARARISQNKETLLAIEKEAVKLLVTRREEGKNKNELYDRGADPAELEDVALQRPKEVKALRQELDLFLEHPLPPLKPSRYLSSAGVDENSLKALGYLQDDEKAPPEDDEEGEGEGDDAGEDEDEEEDEDDRAVGADGDGAPPR